jgi:3-deoxy-7-phosphoheptulonate synthase
MVIVLRQGISDAEKAEIRGMLEGRGFRVKEIVGEEKTIFGAVGVVPIDLREVELLPGVASVIPITKPYKFASREFRKQDTIFPVGPIHIGGSRVAVIAGPCSIESREQVMETAWAVRESGAVILRGGAYKPRTSPYAFQGLGEQGLALLKEAGEATGMPVISEVMSTTQVETMRDYVDIYQIGARNMQNFDLLRAVGAAGKAVMLKRGLAATIDDLLMSAEYLLAAGTDHVILCERGIRTFETSTRFTLDLNAIPVVKKLSHLPIFVDPSHGTGLRDKVAPMALAAIAAGADGIVVEVHPDPDHALSDGPQSIYPEQFEKLMRDIQALAPVLGKEVSRLPQRTAGAGRAGQADASAAAPSPAAAAAGTRVAFQGERGAFSEKAIRSEFQNQVEPCPRPAFRDVFDAVLSGDARYGVVPIENSLAGSIHENYDLLLEYPDLRIVGQRKIRIVHNLIGVPGARVEDVRRVYSHPQGLAQCARFLERYPAWERVPYYDTAGSVAHIAREGRKENAAIASAEAATVYGMSILKEGIETNARNYTRFFVIAREAGPSEGTLASLVFSTADRPGCLYRALSILAERGLNMKKLESRPILGKPWEYMFYVDVEMPPSRESFDEAVGLLKDETEDFRILGIYGGE